MSQTPRNELSTDSLNPICFPEAAAALRSCSANIILSWQKSVCEALPKAEELTLSQLRDHVPLILAQIIEAMESTDPQCAAKLNDVARPHADLRFHQSYDVNELQVEYQILRRILLKELINQLARPLTVDEGTAINAGIDFAQRRSVVAFVDDLTRQLHTADELQTNYISYLNHDLRGGMNGILLMVEVLKRTIASDPKFADAGEDLDAMRRSVLDSVATMDRFVFAHRLGRGTQQPRYATVNIRAIVNEVLSTVNHAAQERQVHFNVNIADNCALSSDRELLRLIIQNLLSNTTKHSRKEGGSVSLTVRPRFSGGCEFTVADEGPGMHPDVVSALFDKSPVVSKGKRQIKLGLPVSKMAADLIGATLTVESTAGVGTTFHLEVPDHGVGDPKT